MSQEFVVSPRPQRTTDYWLLTTDYRFSSRTSIRAFGL
jgi:hypothetical protein